ncbi:MAG: DUF302 domain-containing protein [Gammaproteobacteria bacterium]|nr:DUF302 domain-containing protein [Gammaproteobacteria bacterium]
MDTDYGFGKIVNTDFEGAIDKVSKELQKEGFGILSDIDVSGTFKKKLGKEIPPYRILGACNPLLAEQAISAEPAIGLLLPCNVVVRQLDTGEVRVEFMDPEAVLGIVNNPAISDMTSRVKARLKRVLTAL